MDRITTRFSLLELTAAADQLKLPARRTSGVHYHELVVHQSRVGVPPGADARSFQVVVLRSTPVGVLLFRHNLNINPPGCGQRLGRLSRRQCLREESDYEFIQRVS